MYTCIKSINRLICVGNNFRDSYEITLVITIYFYQNNIVSHMPVYE